MADHSLVKFRPVLTLQQIEYLTYLVRVNDTYEPTLRQSVLKVLVPMIAKVEVGAITPAYKLSEVHMIKQNEVARRHRYENNLMSPEEASAYEAEIMGI